MATYVEVAQVLATTGVLTGADAKAAATILADAPVVEEVEALDDALDQEDLAGGRRKARKGEAHDV